MMKTFVTNRVIRFSTYCLFFILVSSNIQGQRMIYQLHPVVGDTIDSDELRRFLLFSDFLKKDVDYCLLYIEDDKFELLGFKGNGLQFNSVVAEEDVIENSYNIEKLNAYYQSKEEKDSIVIPTALELKDLPVVDLKVDKERLYKEIRQMNNMKDRRESDNERNERVRKGIHML